MLWPMQACGLHPGIQSRVALQKLSPQEISGMTVGSAVANAVTVVGSRVIEAPTMRISDFDDTMTDLVNDVGSQASQVLDVTATTTRQLAQKSARMTIRLAETTLEHAKKTAEQGAKVATAVGNAIANAAVAFGNEVAKVGPLVVGMSQTVWNQVKSFINCARLSTSVSLCHVLIGKECDCNAGSYVRFTSSQMEVRCKFSRTSEFAAGVGIRTTSAKTKTPNVLPGSDYEQAFKTVDQVMKSHDIMKEPRTNSRELNVFEASLSRQVMPSGHHRKP